MKMDRDKTFQTSDFPLATFLFAKGIILRDIIDSPYDRQRKVFIFDTPSPALLSSFQSGKAEINVLALNNAHNALMAMLRGKR